MNIQNIFLDILGNISKSEDPDLKREKLLFSAI
jgi:hypothetical protein